MKTKILEIVAARDVIEGFWVLGPPNSPADDNVFYLIATEAGLIIYNGDDIYNVQVAVSNVGAVHLASKMPIDPIPRLKMAIEEAVAEYVGSMSSKENWRAEV